MSAAPVTEQFDKLAKRPGLIHRDELFFKALEYADRNGVNMGGLFLLAVGMYGGSYARLFPDSLQNIAGAFCLLVATTGFGIVILELVRRRRDVSIPPTPKFSDPTSSDAVAEPPAKLQKVARDLK